ncbi:hypothetical protein [Streptomyces sp. NE06-03C]
MVEFRAGPAPASPSARAPPGTPPSSPPSPTARAP